MQNGERYIIGLYYCKAGHLFHKSNSKVVNNYSLLFNFTGQTDMEAPFPSAIKSKLTCQQQSLTFIDIFNCVFTFLQSNTAM